ncbi:MAG: SURF1 family cytochrome oxidase biogenesis protein, partial [Alphaproteobacteria bacterium]|nr:SURF1 family cytochrome oxidase biogenesis protein [Alphaproteobacteria bacterium]
MKFRKPELLPTLFFVSAFCVMCALGIWQLNRLAWKTEIIAQTEVAAAAPALASLPQDVSGLAYRRVILTGKFLHDKTIHLIGRQQGMEVGYYMVTPLALDDDGRIILVNRGFSPV